MSTILQNSIWPNTEGNLGSIKVQIPDGVNTFWPEGDALVHNFVYKDGVLVGFVDTKALSVNDSKSSAINYDYVNIHLASIKEGDITFNRGERSKYFNVTYGSGNSGDTIILGTKYLGCKTVADVNNIDANYQTNDIVDGLWSQSLADLSDGKEMFASCHNLISFKSDLSSLTDGSGMFIDCYNLYKFDTDLSSLKFGLMMFSLCENLTSFNGDLSSLKLGSNMFEGCSNLTSFNSNLSNLGTYFDSSGMLPSYQTDSPAYNMFYGCKLDTASIQNIADTIGTPNFTTGIHIGIGNSEPNTQENDAFYKMASKHWVIYVNGKIYNPTAPAAIATLDENDEEIITPIPFYAKPVPATEKTASYVDANGNFFNIVGAQFIYGDDLSTYGMFTCEEDAAFNMGLTKIEKENQYPSLPAFFNN